MAAPSTAQDRSPRAAWTLAALTSLLMVVPALAGCLGAAPPDAGGPAGADADGVPTITPDPLVSYLHDVSEPDANITVESSIVEHHRVPAPDGALMDTWVVRPDVDGPVPVVLQVTPYYGGGSPMDPQWYDALDQSLDGDHAFGTMGEILVSRGYAYGIASVRGTGNSEGCFTIGGPTEAKDTAAVVEHYGGLEWSNGHVGLIGASYPGTTPKDVWVEAPPSLKTIVPAAGISDLYRYNFVQGVPINVQGFGFNTYYWVLVGLGPVGLSGGNQVLDPASLPTAVAGEACADQVAVQEGGVSSTLDGNKDDYWQVRDFLAELEATPGTERASVFLVHGLQDWNVKPHNLDGWIEAVQATGVPFKAFLGQWGHAWPESASGECDADSTCRNDWWEQALVAWFDRFLKERETGILDAPAVQVQDDDGRWRHEHAWPPHDAEPWALHPDAEGTLGDEPPADGGEVSYHDYEGGLTDGYDVGPLDRGPDRVVWRSAPLDEDVHISGVPVFEADVTASGRRASLMLTLAEETGDGTLRPFNFAAQSLNHVESLEDGALDVSGQTLRVTARFFPQDDVAHAGNRLVLIAAGNLVHGGEPGPSLQPVSDGSTITIDLDGARLVLPVDEGLVFEDPQPFDDAADDDADQAP